MRLVHWIAPVLCACVFGCASGPSHTKLEQQIPALSPANGRVYFYRDGSPVGWAVQPDVKVNKEKVGKSVPDGFFFIDRPPGTYMVSTKTEKEYDLMLDVRAAETYYVRTKLEMGMWVGRVGAFLEDKDEAMKTLEDCSYIGYLPELGGKAPKQP